MLFLHAKYIFQKVIFNFNFELDSTLLQDKIVKKKSRKFDTIKKKHEKVNERCLKKIRTTKIIEIEYYKNHKNKRSIKNSSTVYPNNIF